MLSKDRAVFSDEIAGRLCKMGFQIKAKKRHHEKPWCYVFYFERTPALEAAFSKILLELKQNKN